VQGKLHDPFLLHTRGWGLWRVQKNTFRPFCGQNRKTQFPIFKTQFRFFGQITQLFLKNSAKTYEKTQFWVEKLSYSGENSVQKGQNSVFQKNQKRKKRGKCPKIKPV